MLTSEEIRRELSQSDTTMVVSDQQHRVLCVKGDVGELWLLNWLDFSQFRVFFDLEIVHVSLIERGGSEH
mgnify:FL=1